VLRSPTSGNSEDCQIHRTSSKSAPELHNSCMSSGYSKDAFGIAHTSQLGGSAMADRRISAALVGVVVLVIALGGLMGPGMSGTAAAQMDPGVTAQATPTPGTPGGPQRPGAPGYGPGRPSFRPGFAPGYGRRFHSGRFQRGRGRGYGRGGGIAAGVFALQALLRFLLLIALLVIAWKVITSRTLWGRPDAAMQSLRDRFARGDIDEEEFRKRLAGLI
jgi:uncharacterized membrane protein